MLLPSYVGMRFFIVLTRRSMTGARVVRAAPVLLKAIFAGVIFIEPKVMKRA